VNDKLVGYIKGRTFFLEIEGGIKTVLCYIFKDKSNDAINLYGIIKYNNNERQDIFCGDKHLRQSVGRCKGK
jgi:hypothetical protein